MITILTALFTLSVQANAMSYEQAREYALFLTDKMAYELNLTDDQYEAAYEINLDYLMGIDSYDDLYGRCWTQRNLDLSYILLSWQYNAYVAASYFYRPLVWRDGFWRFPIYVRYPHRTYLYFGRPHFVTVYRGGHSWRHNGGRSWYKGRSWRGPSKHGGTHFGMRDRYKRGDFGPGGKRNPPRGGSSRPGNVRPGNASGKNNGHHAGGVFGNGRRDKSPANRIGTGSDNKPRKNDAVSNRPHRGFGNARSNGGSYSRQPSGNGVKSSTRVTVRQNRSSNFNGSFRNNTSRKSGASVSPRRHSGSNVAPRQHSGSRPSAGKSAGGKFGGGRR